jgi:hypothetical protein
MIPTKNVYILILRTYGYVTFHSKMELTDTIKLRDLSWEIILDYLGRPNVITGSL